MNIRLYEADYQPFIGQPYLLLSIYETEKKCIIEIFGILLKDIENPAIKVKVFSYHKDDNLFAIFPDINAIIEKDVLPNAHNFIYYKFILPELKNENYRQKPVFKEIGKEYFGLLFYKSQNIFKTIYRYTSNQELKDYIDKVQPIIIDLLDEKDLL